MHHRHEINSQNKVNLLYISKTKIEDSFIPSKHSHPNLELLLITEGEGKFFFEKEEISVKKGDFIIINKNSSHYESNIGLQFYAMGFKNLEIGDLSNLSKNISIFSLNNDFYEEFINIYKSVYKEAKNKQIYYLEYIENFVLNLFVLIRRLNKVDISEISSTEFTPLIEATRQIIENNFSKDFKIQDLASRLNVSPYYLSHRFKEETNVGIIEYKIICQLKEAINLLNQTDMTISEIASLVGFNSDSYFSLQFKKHYKINPKKFRNLKK